MSDSPTMNLAELFRPRRDMIHESPNVDDLSSFLATFPTQLHYTKPEYDSELWVFWSQTEPSQNNSSSNDPGLVPEIPDAWAMHEKIKSSFSNLELTQFAFRGLIQFWAPVTTGGRHLLTTSDQPFALSYLGTSLEKYRLCSLKYQYNVDVNKLEVEEDPMIITGAPATAFLNHFPEIVLDLTVHQASPLVRVALECELMAYIVLPICDPSQRCCVGVLECFMKQSDCPPILFFYILYKAMQGVDLSIFHVQRCLPYKAIHGLEHARDEIGEALKIVCESHFLGLAQVWIPYKDENHESFASSMEDTQLKPVLALKMVGYGVGLNNEGLYWPFSVYHDACDMLPLKKGQGLAGKTLQNHEPHFCRKILPSNVELLVSLTGVTECSCFTICLRSNYTRDFDYVFEFLWPEIRDCVILLESLLLTLKRCLPSFKFASGVELGDELRVVDVDNSSGSEVSFFKICKGIRLSPKAKVPGEERRPMVEGLIAPLKAKYKTTPISLDREIIEQQFGMTMKEAARNLNVGLTTLKRKCKDVGIYEWQGPKFVKRMVNDLHNNQIVANEEDNGAIQDPYVIDRETNVDENTLTIKAEYGDDVIKFSLPVSTASLEAIEEEIGKRFGLNHGSYKLKYRDEDGDLILMISDQDLRDCIKTSRSMDRPILRLHVLTSNIQSTTPLPS